MIHMDTDGAISLRANTESESENIYILYLEL